MTKRRFFLIKQPKPLLVERSYTLSKPANIRVLTVAKPSFLRRLSFTVTADGRASTKRFQGRYRANAILRTVWCAPRLPARTVAGTLGMFLMMAQKKRLAYAIVLTRCRSTSSRNANDGDERHDDALHVAFVHGRRRYFPQ